MTKTKVRKKIKIKKGDTVLIIAGNYKGVKGEVKEVIKAKNRLIVTGVNLVKRHTKPTSQNPNGGIIEKENSIHISNASLIDVRTGKPSRVGRRLDETTNKYIRYYKKSGEAV